MPLYQLADFFKLQFMFKFTKQLLPSSFDNLWLYNGQTRNEDIHISEKYKRFLCPKNPDVQQTKIQRSQKRWGRSETIQMSNKKIRASKKKFMEVQKKASGRTLKDLDCFFRTSRYPVWIVIRTSSYEVWFFFHDVHFFSICQDIF